MTQFELLDEEAFLNSVGKKDILNSLTTEDVERFLHYLGAPVVHDKKGLITSTICHNPIDEASSMKLYYYSDRKIFHCYTECGDSFSIFELYKRYMALNHSEITDDQAVYDIAKFLKRSLVISSSSQEQKSNLYKDRYTFEKQILTSEEYPICVLDCFTKYYHPSWLREGISKESMDHFKICFSIFQNKIIIPHFDINGRLIGIRGRALEEEDIKLGKYRPVVIGQTIYSHPLGWNLYGIYEHFAAIQKYHKAIIYESEKSVMKDETFYGKDSCAVAVCGSHLNKNQIGLLKKAGATEIVLAFDKEYVDCYSEKGKKYRQKIIDMGKRYSYCASFYYLFDEKNLLEEKDAPIDKGLEVFETLYRNKIRIR